MAADEYGATVYVGMRTVKCIGGLDKSIKEDDLYSGFICFGEIEYIEVPKIDGGKSGKGFAYIRFLHPEDAHAAIDNMHMNELHGHTLRCNFHRASVK